MILLRDVRLVPVNRPAPEHPVAVRLAGGRVVEVAPGLAPAPGEEVLAGGGRWLIPGLWDAHLHLGQWARQGTRLELAGTSGLAVALPSVPDPIRP